MIKRRDFMTGVGLVVANSVVPFAALAGAATAIAEAGIPVPSANLPADLRFSDLANLASPPHKFDSNHNYFIYGGGQPIRGLVVTIEVTEDIVAPIGMSFQLNAYSPANARTVYQQYSTGVDPGASSHLTEAARKLYINWSIDNWPSKDYRWSLRQRHLKPCDSATETSEKTCTGDLVNVRGPLGVFQSQPDRVPKGYKIRHELLYDSSDQSGAVIGVHFSVTDDRGRVTNTDPKYIRSTNFDRTKRQTEARAMVPILALQLNAVGLSNGHYMHITSGAGTITYEATTPLTAEGSQPSTMAAQRVFTKESSNIRYALLGTGSSSKIVQKFRAV
jgi:hypothetical protein